MSPETVTVRLARPADGARCNDFYNRNYRRSRSLRQWEWEFCRRLFDDGIIPFAVAEQNGEVVGTQALIPIELVDVDGVYWSAKSEETLVSATMRGQGLFKRLYEPLIAIAQRHRLESIWGFTPARSAFEKEGFGIPAHTGQLFRCFSHAAIAGLLSSAPQERRRRVIGPIAGALLASFGSVAAAVAGRRVPRGAGLELITLDHAPDWADAMSLQFARDWEATTVHRSADYMRWRFFENPFRQPLVVAATVGGRPVGWVAFGLGSSGVAAVVDVIVLRLSPPIDTAVVLGTLLGEATRRCRDMGASAIRAWDVTRHPFTAIVYGEARRLGWIRARRGFDMVLKHTPGLQLRAHATTIDHWYVTRAFTEGSDV